LEELLLVVLDDWGLVMATGEQLLGVHVDVLLVESLQLTKEGGIFLWSATDALVTVVSLHGDPC
jgi:hypothetical protein